MPKFAPFLEGCAVQPDLQKTDPPDPKKMGPVDPFCDDRFGIHFLGVSASILMVKPRTCPPSPPQKRDDRMGIAFWAKFRVFGGQFLHDFGGLNRRLFGGQI